MADGMNKVILIGNLGADPELKYTQGNSAVLKLRLATTETYSDKSGAKQSTTQWHTVSIWGKRAEALNKILAKGRTICVEGSISYEQWQDKDGQKRNSTVIKAREVILLGGGQRSPEEKSGGHLDRAPLPGGQSGDDFGGGGDFGADEIPFAAFDERRA